MQRSLRSTLLLVFAVLALAVSACGVEAGSGATGLETVTSSEDPGSETPSSTSTTSTPQPDNTDPAQQSVIDTYVELGFTQEEAECLTGALFGLMDDEGPVDNSGIMDAVNECDIPISRLADIGEAAGGTTEDGMRLGLETSLKNQGLSSSEASCVADEYIAEFGTDPLAINDQSALTDLLETCGLTLNDLGN